MINKKIEINYSNNVIKLYEDNICIRELNQVYIGKNGLTNNKVEGDFCTPIGEYNLGFAFGTMNNEFEYPYYKLNDKYYWVDDINSPYYNNLVVINDKSLDTPYPYLKFSDQITWNSAEHLIDYPIAYELAIVVEYNTQDCIPGKGSAIFLHIQNEDKDYTAGCIATTKENLLFIINWIDKDNAKIIIK